MFDVRTSVSENHMSVEALARAGVTPESVTSMLDGRARAWVAEHNGKVVAFSVADAETATIFALFVRPEHQGKGLGRALLREAEQWLFSEGGEEASLLTAGAACDFYARLGWASAGPQDDGQVRYMKRSTDTAA